MKKLSTSFCVECPSFHAKQHRSFHVSSYIEGQKILVCKSKNHLLFILSGGISITKQNSISIETVHENEIALLPHESDYVITANIKCKILSLGFLEVTSFCDKLSFKSILEMSKGYEYKFHSLKMNSLFNTFALSIVHYMSDNISCVYLEKAKLAELFVLCRHYFTPVELFGFFYPLLTGKIYFRSEVMAYLPIAKNAKDLARLMGYSVDTFYKVFSSHFNESPYQWMLQQRSTFIKERLMEEDVPVKVIVDEFGFSSQSHFNTFCKRYLGGTPKQIRRGKIHKQVFENNMCSNKFSI